MAPVSLSALLRYYLRLGTLGFGGPIALVGAMHRDLVEQRAWLSEEEYREGLALAQLALGPLAAQLAFSVGYAVPSFFTVIPAPYFRRHGQKAWLAAVVAGVTAAAVGAIAGAVVVLGRRAIVDLPTLLLALAALILTARFRRIPESLVVLAAAVAGLLLKR